MVEVEKSREIANSLYHSVTPFALFFPSSYFHVLVAAGVPSQQLRDLALHLLPHVGHSSAAVYCAHPGDRPGNRYGTRYLHVL